MEPVDPCVALNLVPPNSKPIIVGANQADVIPLPTIRTPTNKVITRWTFTDQERKLIADGEDLYIVIYAEGSIQPLRPSVGVEDWSE